MKVSVKNIPNTGNNHCDCCGTWVKHWEKYSDGKPADHCYACGATGEKIVGGHVKKDQRSDYNEYIIPLCPLCDRKDLPPFQVELRYLVRRDLCERRQEGLETLRKCGKIDG